MSGELRKDDLSKKSHAEHGYDVTQFLMKSLSGTLAPIGLSGLGHAVLDLLVSDPAAKRRDRFIMDLTRRIETLEEEGKLSLDDLKDNEEVAALLMRATQAAMRSSGEQKLRAIREAALRGLLSGETPNTSPAQTVVGLLDRMTEYHVILLVWKRLPRAGYTLRDLQADEGEEARRSYFYGQPVFTDKMKLKDPVGVLSYLDWGLYVERDDHTAFELALWDLAAMGLLKPVLAQEEYLEGRVVKKRATSEIVDHEISELGKLVCDFIKGEAQLP